MDGILQTYSKNLDFFFFLTGGIIRLCRQIKCNKVDGVKKYNCNILYNENEWIFQIVIIDLPLSYNTTVG